MMRMPPVKVLLRTTGVAFLVVNCFVIIWMTAVGGSVMPLKNNNVVDDFHDLDQVCWTTAFQQIDNSQQLEDNKTSFHHHQQQQEPQGPQYLTSSQKLVIIALIAILRVLLCVFVVLYLFLAVRLQLKLLLFGVIWCQRTIMGWNQFCERHRNVAFGGLKFFD